MTPDEREAFYDAEIAPELARLAKLCEDNGLAFLALAEWNPEGEGEWGRTVTAPAATSNSFKMAHAAAQARGNLDSLAFAWAKHARIVGHGSIVLKQLGVPEAPETPPHD